MSARTERRAEVRTEQNRRAVNRAASAARLPGLSRQDWADLDRNQRRVIADSVQVAVCPTCGRVVPGLLAGCDQVACRAADHDFDADLDARCSDD